MKTVEIFANENGNIAVKIDRQIFELSPTETISAETISSEKYKIITKDIWIAIPVGGGESWTVELLLNKNDDFAIYIDNANEYVGAEKIPVSVEYLKERKFELKGVAKVG